VSNKLPIQFHYLVKYFRGLCVTNFSFSSNTFYNQCHILIYFFLCSYLPLHDLNFPSEITTWICQLKFKVWQYVMDTSADMIIIHEGMICNKMWQQWQSWCNFPSQAVSHRIRMLLPHIKDVYQYWLTGNSPVLMYMPHLLQTSSYTISHWHHVTYFSEI